MKNGNSTEYRIQNYDTQCLYLGKAKRADIINYDVMFVFEVAD